MTLEEFILENELILESVEVQDEEGNQFLIMDDGEIIPILGEKK